MNDKIRKIEVGDTWSRGSLNVEIFGYTANSCGFVIFRAGHRHVGWLGDYEMVTERVFRRDFVFSYADPDRKEPMPKKIKRKYNQVIENLIIS